VCIGDLILYYCPNNERIGKARQRQADYTITMGRAHLTSVYTPDLQSGWAYGDMQGTSDLLIMRPQMSIVDGAIQQGGKLEIIIARGRATQAMAVYNEVVDGLLDEEIEALRTAATDEQFCSLMP